MKVPVFWIASAYVRDEFSSGLTQGPMSWTPRSSRGETRGGLDIFIFFEYKRKILFLICFLFSISVSHPSTSLPSPDDFIRYSLESHLQHIKSLLASNMHEGSEVDAVCAPQTIMGKPCEIDAKKISDISQAIDEMEYLYKSGKYGNPKALSDLKLKAKGFIYALVLMMKYHSSQEKLNGLRPFSSPEVKPCIPMFIALLGEDVMASYDFIEIEDPFFNLSLALYHQTRGDNDEVAEQFAQAAANQGCVEGYNIIGNLYKKIDKQKSIEAYIKSAAYGNPKGIYKLARLCAAVNIGLDQERIKDLYIHAAIQGSPKAYFAIGKWYEKKYQKDKSIAYILHLIEMDPYLYVHMEQKEGLGNTAFHVHVVEKLLSKEPKLFPPFLRSIYERNLSKRKRISHIFAMGHLFGKYGFPRSRKDAYHWLRTSATEHKNLQDGYQFCSMRASDIQCRESNASAIAIGRRLLESPEFLEEYGTVPLFLLVQLLVMEAENQDNPAFLEEASYWLLKALNDFEQDSARRKKITWQLANNTRGEFSAIKNAHLDTIEGNSSSLVKRRASFALGFHHLSGGFMGHASLTEAQRYFLRAETLSPSATFFYVTVIGHYLSMERLMHSLEDYNEREIYQQHEAIRKAKAIKTYRIISGLLDRHKDLGESERDLLKKKVRELSATNLEEASLALASWFHFGIFGLSPSTEHEIYWLKYAASKDDETAQRLLGLRYPLVPSLTEAEESALHHARTHSADNKPNATIIGAGMGAMAAIVLAKAREEGKILLGKITVVDQNLYTNTGASGMISRQHRGGEYPKEKDHMTGMHCLLAAALMEQLFPKGTMLTEKMKNEFLLARKSQEAESGESALSKEELLAHHTFLDELYKKYLKEFKKKDKDLDGEDLLFGPSLFKELTEADLESLGVSAHFGAGVSTGERGFNPIAMGTILEFLLRKYNVNVITDYEVTNVTAMKRGGFQIEGRGQRPIYTQFLVNAAWHNNSRLSWLLKASLPGIPVASSSISVFIRCIALINISGCTFPENRSFFGLLGEEGGMVSAFNDWIASVFVPKDGLSYHGEYTLDESAVNTLPRVAREKLAQLKADEMEIAAKILEDATRKFPFLGNAESKGLSIHTTVSNNFEIYKRNHINVKWVEGVEGCAELCSTKGTFGAFLALQLLARFAVDKPNGLENNFNETEKKFLKSLIDPDMFKEGAVESVVLPDSLKIDSLMPEAELHAAMRRYAFVRGLDFAIFEKTRETALVGTNPIDQLRLIGEEEGLESLDLEAHTLNNDTGSTLFPLLGNLSNIKLGPLEEGINEEDQEDDFGEATLKRLLENDHLKNLTLKGWNLMFSSRYNPLAALLPKLQEIHLKGVTLSLKGVQALFGNSLNNLRNISVVNSNLKKSVLRALMAGIQTCSALELIDLSGNEIGKESSGEISRDLGSLVKGSPSLRCLFVHNNRLFDEINLNLFEPISLPLDLEANPFLLAVIAHPLLEKVSVTNNGPASNLLQDHLDSYFLRKDLASLQIVVKSR